MGINLEKLKGRLTSLKNSSNRNNHVWKPKPGTYTIRIVPYVHNPESPFIELLFHYNFNKRTILSPATFGRPDPIVEFADKLKQTGEKEDWLLSKKLQPKMRTYAPIIVRGKENEGVKFWGFGAKIYERLLMTLTDPDFGDITDIKEGRDITVIIKSPEETGKNYTETEIVVKPRQTPVSDDSDVLETIKNQPEISELYPEPTYDELEQLLQDYANSLDDGGVDDDSSETSTSSNASKRNVDDDDEEVATPTKTAKATKTVAQSEAYKDEFDALFGANSDN